MRKINKRQMASMAAIFLAALLSSCGSTQTGQQDESLSPSESISAVEGGNQALNTENSQNKEDGGNGKNSGIETSQFPSGETKDADTGEYMLFSTYYTGNSPMIYLLDSAGNKIREYDLGQIKEWTSAQGYTFYDSNLITVTDGVLYYSNYEQIGSRYGYRCYAVDAESGAVQLLWTQDKDWYLEAADFYQGKLYITSTNGTSCKEIAFSKEEGSLEYKTQMTDLTSISQVLSGYETILPQKGSQSEYRHGTLSRTLDEAGFVIGKADFRYVQVFADGTVSELGQMKGMDGEDGTEKKLFILWYDKNALIYRVYDLDVQKTEYFCYRFGTRDAEQLPWEGDVALLQYEDGKLYTSERLEEEYNININSVYEYDSSDNAVKKLYEKKSLPGTGGLEPGTEGFRVIGGQIFLEDVIGDELKWVRAEFQGGQAQFTDLDCPVKTYDTLKYGSVAYESRTAYCPFCGTPLEKVYEEAFVLDSQYSTHAEKINAFLEERMKAGVQDTEEAAEGLTDEYCEDHQEYPEHWCETFYNEISEIHFLEGRFLTVTMSGYWYGGGVHGYPSLDQYLFDLSTGERLELKDLYEGTEEEFKRLVAEMTREDFLYNEENTQAYFAEDADSVYAEAYERAALDTTIIFFGENGATILYPPYEMGPYAAGFIEVQVPYEALFGREGIAWD